MLSLELRDKIVKYIEDEIKLADLEDWIVPHMFALIQDPKSPESDLAAAVELCLVEFSKQNMEETEVKETLHKALHENNFIVLNIPEDTDFRIESNSASTIDSYYQDATFSAPIIEVIG